MWAGQCWALALMAEYGWWTSQIKQHRLQRAPSSTSIWDVYVSEEYVYVAAWDAGLRVVNVSDPTNPVEVGFYDTPGYALAVHVVGGYAYVADGDAGLRVIDVSDPAAPSEAGFYDPEEGWGVHDVFSTRGYVYLLTSDGLWVMDVLDPTSPQEIGFYDIRQGRGDAWGYGTSLYRDLFVEEDYAYVTWRFDYPYRCSFEESVRVVDVSEPAQPREVSRLPGGGKVYVAGGYAYRAEESFLRVMDVSNPAMPQQVGFYYTLGYPSDVFVVGGYAYLAAGGGDGLRVISVSDPAVLQVVGFSAVNRATDIFVAGGYVYVTGSVGCRAGTRGTLEIIDISDPSHPRGVGGYQQHPPTFSSISDLFVTGDYAYLATGERMAWPLLEVLDVSDPAAPVRVGEYYSDTYADSIFVSGGYAYLTDGYGLRVFDTSDPTALVEVGFYDTPGDAQDVFVAGGYAYVADGNAGLRVIDVSNPAAPVEVGAALVNAHNVYIADEFAYVTGGSSLRVVDVSDPAAPTEVGFYDTLRHAYDVHVAEGYVYVADGDGGLVILRFTGGPACSVDEDGRVSMEDIQTVASHWREQNTSLTDIRRFDVDDDGIITVRDVLLVGRQLGQRCP